MKRIVLLLCASLLMLTGCKSGEPELSSNGSYHSAPASQQTQIGEWFEMQAFSDTINDYAPANFRVTECVVGKDAEDSYKKYFAKHGARYTSAINSDVLEYMLISYEMSLPKDFPASEAGVPVPDIKFTPVCETTSDFKLLSTGIDISDTIAIIHPGETTPTQKYLCVVMKNNPYTLKCTIGNTTKYIRFI